MQVQTITVNGKTLSKAETQTLRMTLAMVTIDLEELDPRRQLEGLEASEHLKNIRQLRMLVGENT